MKKTKFKRRIARIVAHKDNPAATVDAATLLRVESERLSLVGHPLGRKMAWAFLLAAAKLEAWLDPASLVQYQRVKGGEG